MSTTMRLGALAILLSSIVISAACGGAPSPPADARTTVLSMRGLDCAECGDELAGGLAKREGVFKASFDRRRAEVTVVSAPSVDVLGSAKQLAGKEEYELVVGAGKGTYLDWAKTPEGADVKTVAEGGADIPDLAPHIAPGKVTLVDFSAIWCEPCRKLDEHVMKMLEKRGDLAYRKLDVGDWDTPLAKRYLKGIPNLPYVIVYDKGGKQVDAIAGLDLPRLDAAIAKGAR
jgi:thiol-disulfide isomerase/thioredoxin